jgi:hypothetical protein
MAHRNDDHSELSRLVRRSGSPNIDDVATVVAVALRDQKREIIEHISRMFQQLNSSAKQLDAHAQHEKDRLTRLTRRVFAAESEIRRIRAGKP